jgi:hypothetical protein
MTRNDRQLRSVLAKIAELAEAALSGTEWSGDGQSDLAEPPSEPAGSQGMPGCVVKTLPRRLLLAAAETATKINPANAPAFGPMALTGGKLHLSEPLHIAVMTAKYWGPSPRTLSVSFMESTPGDLRTRIISHMNAWSKRCCIKFAATNGTGDVRISREAGGYYSYLGTDILHIPKNRQTMNLEGFTMKTPEPEYKRVVRHETGHTLGFPHEHMRRDLVARIDPEKAYAWFLETYGWDRDTVDSQVLTPLDEASLMGTPVDQTSIMCYQLPGAVTTDGKPIIGGIDINETDFAFAARIYPKVARAEAAPPRAAAPAEEEWSEAEDVAVSV